MTIITPKLKTENKIYCLGSWLLKLKKAVSCEISIC